MDTLYRQFQEALKREGKTVKGYYNNISYKCLFRKNDNPNNIHNYVTIFYEKSSGIYQGQLLSYGSKHYIVINQDTVENDVYLKSDILECNAVLPFIENYRYLNIPCHVYDLTSVKLIQGNVLTIGDGKGEVITEITDKSTNRNLIDSIIPFIGWYYKVENMYSKDGLSHIFIGFTLKPSDSYSFEITADNTQYLINSSTTLTTMAIANNVIDDTATINYTSSDSTVATVDTNGIISFIKIGSVTITATWVEKNLTDTVTLAVIGQILPYNFNVWSSADYVYLGSSSGRTVNAVLTDKTTGAAITFTPSWSFTYGGANSSYIAVTYPTATTCVVKYTNGDNYDDIGKIITVTCTTTVDGNVYTDIQELTLTLY